MRIRSGRIGFNLLIALSAAAVAIECANRSPTDATQAAATTLTSPSPAATLHVTGTVEFLRCTPDAGCAYQGRVINEGGCVKNVHGITHLLDASDHEIEQQEWSINGRMRPKQEGSFNGCCFSSKAVNAQQSSRTEVFAEEVECI
jgi:hypothetical protein